VSGFVGGADRQKMLEIGVDRFIQKPYSPNDVLRKIREVLDKSANGDR
jgi:DNA-binding response OmpR family regulator